jgi:ribosomal protein S18 acetylase RimI-like enzyme
MHDARVRSARRVEVARLLDLWRSADAVPSVGEDIDTLSELLDQQPDGVLVAELDGVIVGSLIAAWDGWRGNMYRLAVLPEHRRLGIARALVNEGERRLRDQGCVRITALVMHEHDHVVRFWEAVGYEHDERTARHARNLK